jgi:KDO2-lipid IV(A) lauroyltransferase
MITNGMRVFHNRLLFDKIHAEKEMKSFVISSEAFGTGVAILLGQGLRPWLGYRVARFIGWVVSCFPGGAAYRSLALNQWIVSGKTLGKRELNLAVRKIFRNQALALYDFYHALDRPELIQQQVKFTEKFEKLIGECKRADQPTLLLIPHLSGFNMGGLRLAQYGLRYLTLAYPNPSSGYQWQNKLRNDRGMEVIPFTIEALGQARKRLQQGGTVLTGVDRPLEESNYHPQFFGYPTNLPVAYVRLALKTNARVFVVGFMTLNDHTYLIDVSDQVHLQHNEDAELELELNAEKILLKAEEFIRRDPYHWMMFYPVWPDEMSNLEKIL